MDIDPVVMGYLNMPKVVELVKRLKTFFENNNFTFTKMEVEQTGKNKYLRVTVSIKLD